LSDSDQGKQLDSADLPEDLVPGPAEGPARPEDIGPTGGQEAGAAAEGEAAADRPRRRILIGSQRDPAAYGRKRARDWEPVIEPESQPPETPGQQPETDAQEKEAKKNPSPEAAALAEAAAELDEPIGGAAVAKIPPPNIREELPPDLQDELKKALADASVEKLMSGGDALCDQPTLEEDSLCTGRVVTIRGDDVFVELGTREQGVVSAKQFEQLPDAGAALEVVVRRFNADEGLYELSIPNAAAAVGDWDDLHEGMTVEARVSGHNSGGLECEVNHLRGFIPVSQIDLYRVEDLAQFVDQKFMCLVTEANPQRRNLVLSRRAVLEREKEEARQKLLDSLQPGQIHEGVVRKLMDFGAFVDIGGIDGLLHVSQLAWYRVDHPSEVLNEGQTIKVKIEKIDHSTGKMSLTYREMLENPWQNAPSKYPRNSVVKGKVSKLMDFGAFVALEPGVEGLVHVSELSHKRVWRPGDVVAEGQEVEVLVLSVDAEAQRISLSMKQLAAPPEPAKKAKDSEAGELPKKSSKRRKPSKPLTGGLGRSSGGEGFGLKW